jgi:hypothetical protein
MVHLFDISNGKVIPTRHCYTLRFLKRIMDEYPANHLTIYLYLYYMCYPDPKENPFFHFNDKDKEEAILEEIGADFSTEDDAIFFALEQYQRMCETETSRAYNGIKKVLDNLADYMNTTAITDGRDGNITQIVNSAVKFDQIRQSYKGTYKDLMDEQQSAVRGGQDLAYDQ